MGLRTSLFGDRRMMLRQGGYGDRAVTACILEGILRSDGGRTLASFWICLLFSTFQVTLKLEGELQGSPRYSSLLAEFPGKVESQIPVSG